MEHYLNFSLTGVSQRFHISLPWNNLHIVNFYDIETHLQSTVPEELYDRTRKLKPSNPEPEPGSLSFHDWLRQGQTHTQPTPYSDRHELAKLLGGHIHQVGFTQEGYPYLIIKQPNSETVLYAIAQANPEGSSAGFLQITERKGHIP